MIETSTHSRMPVVLQTGFRIFFLGAVVHTVLSMLAWFLFYLCQVNIFVAMPLTVWHAHEMVFGFSMAVIAGFLLTAVTNWTGLPTLSGAPLLILFLLWALARVLAFLPATVSLWPMIICNVAFMVYLTIAVMIPIIKVRQWRQSAVFSKLMLMMVSSGVLYWALLHQDFIMERKTIRFTVYMVISLILTMGRRIMPFFIEGGVGYPMKLRNSRVLDIVSLVLLVVFCYADIFTHEGWLTAAAALLLALVHALRLAGWHTHGVWQRPLLWILFAGYMFLILGFLLKAAAFVYPKCDDSALHAFTTGGIGIFCIGMMARVSLGHTGRGVGRVPPLLETIFYTAIVSALIRVVLTLGLNEQYGIMIGASQILWMTAFVLFLVVYWGILTSARVDGKMG